MDVAVGVANAAREQIEAEILDALGGKRRDERAPTRSRPPTPCLAVQSPPTYMIQNTAKLNANCGMNRPSRPPVTKPNRLLAHSSALLLSLA